MKSKHKRPYLKQKLLLYFDANFPREIIDYLKSDSAWKRKCKIRSIYEDNNQSKDDKFLFNYCKKQGYTLVTLDKDFMDDSKFPLSNMPGIIRISATKNDVERIERCLNILLSFVSFFPWPRLFVTDTKFQVSPGGCIIRGRDAVTREIKTLKVTTGDTMGMVMRKFNY